MFEHIKSRGTTDEGKPTGTKTHAGGGHDRQDSYLYGHPAGRKKRFRSPADFVHHLVWLATDEENSPGNCACKLCSPDDIQPDFDPPLKILRTKKSATAQKERVESEKAPIKKGKAETQEKVPTGQAAHAAASQFLQASTKLHQTGVSAAGSAVTIPSAQRFPAPQQLIAAHLPQISSFEQKIDLESGKFAFRNGELVWFCREQETWGLAVIVQRWLSHGKANYMVEALSYPNGYVAPKAIDIESDVRPFLAWSPPDYINESLRQPTVTFDNADWPRLAGTALASGLVDNQLLIDASILAARKIEGSYTLLEPGLVLKNEINVQIRRWNGMYLGAERIWVGDPVRIRAGVEDVFVVHQILERITSGTGYFTNTTVTLMGERWTTREVAPGRALPPVQANIPMRMSKDIEYRNAFAAAARQPQVYWELLDKNKTFELANVRGRWYESSMLLPILDPPAVFAANKAAGRVGSSNPRLNHRGESIGSSRENVRKMNREDAFVRAVPAATRIVTGTIDPPPGNEIQQPPQQAQAQPQQHGPVQAGNFGGGEPAPDQAMDDLVNFDPMDTEMFGGQNQMFGL